MKELFDGTLVELSTPTKMTPEGRKLLTDDEVAEVNSIQATARQESLKEYLASYRWQRETEGVVVGDIRFWTARETRSTWNRLISKAENDSTFVQPVYKAMNGTFTNVAAATIIEADNKGLEHITKCFIAEAQLENQIFNSKEELEAAFDAAYDNL